MSVQEYKVWLSDANVEKLSKMYGEDATASPLLIGGVCTGIIIAQIKQAKTPGYLARDTNRILNDIHREVMRRIKEEGE